MNQGTSCFLDCMRFAAACVVLLSHLSGQRLSGGFLWPLEPEGTRAVMVFFVMSGFVIGHVRGRETGWTAFAVNRLARLYSVVIPALVLTFVLDRIGSGLRPALYSPSWGYDPGLAPYLKAVTFLGQLWVPRESTPAGPGSDVPFWSLGYEAIYYALFAIVAFRPDAARWVIGAVVLLIAGPYVAAYLPVWLLGLFAYRLCASRAVPAAAGWGLLVLAPPAFVAYALVTFAHGQPPRLVDSYTVAFLFTAVLIGFDAACRTAIRLPGRLVRSVRWLAGGTFSIYLAHLPLLQVLAAASPWPVASWQCRALLLVATPCLCFLFAEISERRKGIWRSLIERVLRAAGGLRSSPPAGRRAV